MSRQVDAPSDRQISLTDPDVPAVATNGRGTGLAAYNAQAAAMRTQAGAAAAKPRSDRTQRLATIHFADGIVFRSR